MLHRNLTILLVNTLFFLTLISGVQGQEQIWDKDLNRYLTPQEMVQEDVYLTPEDAAKLMFPKSDSIRSEVITITDKIKAEESNSQKHRWENEHPRSRLHLLGPFRNQDPPAGQRLLHPKA